MKKYKSTPANISHDEENTKKGSVFGKTSVMEDSASVFLIRFDLKTKLYLCILFGLFVFFVIQKYHGSSVAMWNQVLPGPGITPKTGLVAGTPKSIRSDDWLAYLTFYLTSAAKDFPTENPQIGPGKINLVVNIPHRILSGYLKPMFWGAYFLDVERGFAWQWSFRIFFTIAASFLFFMLITQNAFWISLLGSFWVFLTPTTQWWSLYPGGMFAEVCAIFVCVVYILFTRNIWVLAISIFSLVCVVTQFLGHFYPAFMIPFVYFLLISLLAFLAKHFDWSLIKPLFVHKIIFSVIGLLLFITAATNLFIQLKPAAEAMMNTAYPGKRFATGGDYPIYLLFSSFFGFWMNETKLPQQWGNICELSATIFVFPVGLYFTIRNIMVTKKLDVFACGLSILLLLHVVYLHLGFTDTLSKFSLFYFTPASRLIVPMGYINLVLFVYLLSTIQIKQVSFSNLEIVLATFLLSVVYFVNLKLTNQSVNFFFKQNEIIVSTLFSTLICLGTFFARKSKYSPIATLVLILITQVKNIYANPLAKGLPSILKNPFYSVTKEIVNKEPDAKWAVFGSFTVSNFIKMAGAECISGISVIPDFEKMKVFDPNLKNTPVYNRYAFMNMASFIYNDSCIVRLEQPDLFTVGVDPCSPRLDKLGVKYVVFTYQPQPAETRCMTLIYNGSVLIYKKD